MVNQKKSNCIILILVIIMISIILLTIYFCLDVFGIIKVPARYSIASMIYSQIEIIATGEEILTENIVIDSNINESIYVKNSIINENIELNKEKQDIVEVQNPLEELEKLQKQEQQDNFQVSNQNIDLEKFYYGQLDQYGKVIYDKLYKNMDKLKTGTYTADFDTVFDDLLHTENGSEILNNSFQLAINALTFDNPELFYIDITKVNLITEITTRAFSTTYTVSIGGNGKSYLSSGFENLNQVNEEISNIENIKNNIINQKNDNQIENMKMVHDYLIDTIEYNVDDGRNIYNIYGALVNKKAVCEGYARTYKLILDELQIPCIIVCGVAKNAAGETESHAWNYVKIDNSWYAVDVTWDDPVIIGNGNLTADIKYRYFLVGSEEFSKDHFEDGNIAAGFNFVYPELNKTNY